jgi:DNA-binding transcriptional LysR family regulator
MDLRRLRHFVVAAEESNFRRAALRLDTNQSIISRHVRDIEEELGADLFLREPGHGARLTEVGRAFLRNVREMFDNLDHAKMAALAVAYGKRGRLRLAASEDVMTGMLARIITAYREQWPEVHFDLLEMPAIAQVRALQHGRIDLGLMLPPVEGTETRVRRVEGVGLHSDQRGAPDVPSSHPRSKPTIIAISALLELVEWLELRRKSRQGGCPCNAAPTPLSPPVSTRSESSASGSGGPPLVQSARAESPGRGPNPAPTPAPKTSRRRRAGGRS